MNTQQRITLCYTLYISQYFPVKIEKNVNLMYKRNSLACCRGLEGPFCPAKYICIISIKNLKHTSNTIYNTDYTVHLNFVIMHSQSL